MTARVYLLQSKRVIKNKSVHCIYAHEEMDRLIPGYVGQGGLQRKALKEESTGSASSSSMPQVPAKRKRGGPRKIPEGDKSKLAMDLVVEGALNEIRGTLGIQQTQESVGLTDLFKTQQVKRSRGRPRKNPLPQENTQIQEAVTPKQPSVEHQGDDSAKRGRGRPRKAPIQTSMIEKEPLLSSQDKIDSISSNSVSELMFVEPAKLLHALPECEVTKYQVDIARVAGPSTTLGLLKEKTLTSLSVTESSPQPVKRGRGRPRKQPMTIPNTSNEAVDTPLPSIGGMVQCDPPVKRKRGRPPKQPSSETTQEPVEERKKRGRPKKESQNTTEPQVKRKPGRPKKNSTIADATEVPIIKRKRGRPKLTSTDIQEPVVKRKRGRPRKDANSNIQLAAVIPAQSSEPIANEQFPTIALSPHNSFNEPTVSLHNISSETVTSGGGQGAGKEGFQLALSSSEYESADSKIEDNVAMAIVTLSGGDPPKQDSPLLNESFDESFDEED